MLLSELPHGVSAKVLRLATADEVSMRLLEMGVTPGVSLMVVGSAPLGDPLELELRGYRLSVRKAEAARVEVEPLASEESSLL